MEFSTSMQFVLAIVMVVYVACMFWIARLAQSQVKDHTDYLVAGRRLSLSLAWMTLMATWFGAGTMLTVANEVRVNGLTAAAMDPLGAGVCLLLAGWFIAGPMWRAKILTVPDLFRDRFGPRSELIGSLIMIPSYFGWVATQLVVVGEMLFLFFGLPQWIGILLVSIVTTAYTLMGGMWSVTLTDAVQVVLMLVGLIVLLLTILLNVGGGNLALGAQTLYGAAPEEHWVVVPFDGGPLLLAWVGLFAVGALGNLPGQDLMQRVFSARSDRVARWACIIAGTVYLAFGAIPIVLAVGAGSLLEVDVEASILPALIHAFLSPPVAILLTLVLLSVVMSTIDSAVLSPAAVLSNNLLRRVSSANPLRLNRLAVVIVAACSLAMAYSGQTAYQLLEDAYTITLVGLFVPMMFALYGRVKTDQAALASMVVGILVWGPHFVVRAENFMEFLPAVEQLQLPVSLVATGASAAAYLAACAIGRR